MADIRRTDGVVIKRTPFSNTSLIATCLTDGFGKVRLVAKGAQRAGSPFRGKLDLFMRNSMLFYHGRGDLHTLKECDTVEAYRGIRESLDRISAASYVAEMIEGLTPDESADAELYWLLVRALDAIGGSGRPAPVAALFGVKILGMLGNFPLPGSCARCGRRLTGDCFFEDRAFSCALCASDSMRVSAGTVGILDSIFSGDELAPLPPAPSFAQMRELLAISSRIFESERGRRMRTKLTA